MIAFNIADYLPAKSQDGLPGYFQIIGLKKVMINLHLLVQTRLLKCIKSINDKRQK